MVDGREFENGLETVWKRFENGLASTCATLGLDSWAVAHPYPAFFRVLSLSLLQRSSINNLLPQSSSSQLATLAPFLHQRRKKPAVMAEFHRLYDTVLQEADDNEYTLAELLRNAFLQEPGLTARTDGEEDAPEKPPSDREDSASSSKDERSGIDKRISPPSPPPPPHLSDCLGFGCTWPCAHHIHIGKKEDRVFRWYPELEHCGRQHPEMPRIQSEMKECQFCRIFFNIRQSDCHCGANADPDRILKSGGCRCKYADCFFHPNGQISGVYMMMWTCGAGKVQCELGLSTGKSVHSTTFLTNLF